MKQIALILIIVFINVSLEAHGGKHEKKMVKIDTVIIAGKDTIAINGKPVNRQMKEMAKDEKAIEHFELEPFKQMFEHLHNKLVHFPIALGVFAFFLSLLNIKWKHFDSTIILSVLIALLFSIAAFITGKNQSNSFIGTSKEWIVYLHQNIGIAVIITLFVWTIFLKINKLKKHAWIVGLISSILIFIAGYLGGVIAH